MARNVDNELASRIIISESSNESPETLERPTDPAHRRETLYQRENEDESPTLTEAQFQDLLEHPETLYNEIVKLITGARDLRAYSENYREQLQETKRAPQKSKIILDKFVAQPPEHTPSSSPAPENSRQTIKLPDPPLSNGSGKDGTTFDNWLILQESVAAYYNDPTVSTSRFARYCTTNDQQIRNRFQRRDQASKKAKDPDKASSREAPRP
ncbi:MAG: hypothetical protein M1839_005936 [Geoglossum umbratile]|nr:MAG: hypothetical protein M1839_005936 [Geoglossum umbratile]